MAASRDPEKRQRQLANLRPAPPAPAGNERALRHGAHTENPSAQALAAGVERVTADLAPLIPGTLVDPATGEVFDDARPLVWSLAKKALICLRLEAFIREQGATTPRGAFRTREVELWLKALDSYERSLERAAATITTRLLAESTAAGLHGLQEQGRRLRERHTNGGAS